MHGIIHGANPEKLYKAFGIAIPPKISDFSTNTNVLPWPQVSLNIEHLASNYPDPECNALREIIASRENISPSRILFTNGTNEAIFLLARLFGEDTAILQPAYSEYFRAFKNLHGAFTLDEALNFRQIIVINPNNPTGKYIPLAEIVRSHPQNVFIVDEAYRDFLLTREPERLCDFENVVILRSLTKIFHLSGARIGYVIATQGIIEALREILPSWSVNGIAQELALCFLKDIDFLERTKAFYHEETPALVEGLKSSGFKVMDSDVHFFLVRVSDDLEAIRRLLLRGIVVRHTRNFAGLDGKYIRVAARLPDENMKLIHAMRVIV